jgi:colicin import membrane protein
MTEVGAISFRAVIDTSSIRGEIARLNQALSNERALIRVAFDTSTIRAEMARINAAIARESTQIKIGVQIDRQALAAAQRQIQQITQGAQQGGQGAAPNAFARDLDAALQRQAKEAANLSREFDKTAAAAEKAANQAARISIRRQEQEAAALARQLQQAERAASQAVNRTNAISLRRQQQETAAFAREFERAADAQRRLQQQQSRDRQTLSGTQFSARETKAIEASIGKVRRETERAAKVAALLRQQYGLTDE